MVTVESLALEVTPLLGSLLALKTANCLFFGDDVVYGDYSNVAQCSSKGNDALGKNKQRDGKKKGCNKGCSSQKPDGLKAALSDMKKTIQNALCDEAGDAGNYAAEIKNLRNEVEIMKKENASLRKSFDEIKETLQKVLAKLNITRSRWPFYCCGSRILIVGDGNLSFSFGLAQLLKMQQRLDVKICASVLEDESTFFSRYPSGHYFYQQLVSGAFPFVEVMFSVDACELPLNWKSCFTSIIWNFPHPGGKSNLRKSRQLLKNALKSVYRILDDGVFFVTLAKGQSGLPYSVVRARNFIAYNNAPNHLMDSWQMTYIAAECGFLITDAVPFFVDQFPDYCGRGYKNTDRMFYNDCEATTLSLKKYSCITRLEDFVRSEQLVKRKMKGMFHELRPYYRHDLSIVYKLDPADIDNWEDVFMKILYRFAGSLLVVINEVKELRSLAPNGYPNRIYRINLNEKDKTVKAEEQSKAEKKPDADDFELFGSSDEEEDEEKQRIIQERLKAYAEKKARKPASVAKSSVILDVKPWDDETDMVEMEKRVRAIEQDGLLWGGSKLIPLAYGLKKLQIISTIEDEKVSVDDLIDRMVEEISEHIQSVDIVAFNKI
uniref:DUF2431 domain-containing protein n=1 Tax=Syphacia muris TaxID=451379 RepID=A0A158R4A3_9BILA